AEIYLNGALLAETDNMFIEHEFAVGTTDDRRPTTAEKRKTENEGSSEAEFINRQPSSVPPQRPNDPTTQRPALIPGSNTLRIVFRSALRTGRNRQQAFIESHPNTQTPKHPHWF